MRRRCLVCRRLTDKGSYCAEHEPVSPSSRAWHKPGAAKLRAYVLERDRHRCTRCGSEERLEVHHLIAVADGGTDDPHNLLTLCADCHRGT